MWGTKLPSIFIKISLKIFTFSLTRSFPMHPFPTLWKHHKMVNGFTFKYILLSKIFCSTRTSISILVIPNSPEMWWRKTNSKVNISIYDFIMTTASERLFNAWIHYFTRIRCKYKVNARRSIFCKMGRFVNNLSIACSQCNVIKFISNIITSIKRIPLWTFPLKSPVLIEITGLRLLTLFIRMSRNHKRTGTVHDFG